MLSAVEIASLPQAPDSGFVRLPIGPDQTHPDGASHTACGAALDAPPLTHGAGQLFESPERYVVTLWVDRLAPGRAQQFLTALALNVRPGCPDYVTEESAGNVSNLPTGPLGDQSFAGLLSQTLAGSTVNEAAIAIRRGRYAMVIVVYSYSPTPIPQPFVIGLSRLADRHLAGLSGG
jgi:hypothetical protein